ncbi:MAG TPA: bifunctional riboflavin kinase/FAD synthetase [Candidatus Binatia bacterium]|nr:bifunctional riboflavin kinase/FAD synthetase [Candidatus Binatia bacterium]
MQIIRHIGEQCQNLAGSVVTLGNFDGIHLGHQALITGAVGDAKILGLASVVLTFEPHPLAVLAPGRAPKLILAHKDKMQLLQGFGVDIVAVQHFDLAFARVSAADFVRDLLVKRLKAKKIWVGKDLRFGQGRSGGVDDLKRWGSEFGFETAVVEPILVDGNRVSSSRIREFLGLGRVEEATAMLGRYHFVSGRVVEGHHRGKELGFPTANLATRTEVLPADGIYATLFHLGGRVLASVSSIGLNPTFGAGPRTVESFIIGFDENIYGAAVRLAFVKRIRDEVKFSSVPDLVEQIHDDVRTAKNIFRELGIDTPTSLSGNG